MKNYVTAKTTEGTTVHFRVDHVAAIEEIAGSVRTTPYLKVFVAGYTFFVNDDLKTFMQKLGEVAE